MISPAQAAQKLGDGIRTGQTAYQQGVNAVTENPAAKAVAARSKWVQAMQNPETHDKWQQGLENTSLQGWKSATAGVGAQRFAQSADKAQTNYQEFANSFFPFLEGVQAQVNAMPTITFEERVAKAVENMRLIHQYQRP